MIVAVGMGVLMSALTSSARTVVYLQDKTFAEWVGAEPDRTAASAVATGTLPPQKIDQRRPGLRRPHVALAPGRGRKPVPGIERIDFKVRPKEVKGGDDDSWYVTVSGIAGSAIGTPGLATLWCSWDGGRCDSRAAAATTRARH